MNIKDFTSYFHDGSILGINHFSNGVEILMESCEILPEWDVNTPLLSKFRTIAGSLILSGVNKIIINDEEVKELLMRHDDGEILHFGIKETSVELLVIWQNHPIKLHSSEYNQIIICAEQIKWINNPKLSEDYQD